MRRLIKIVLVGSVIVSSFVAMLSAIRAGRSSSPLDGAWVVASFDAGPQPGDSVAPAAWQRLLFDGRGLVIRSASGTPVRCRIGTATELTTIPFTCAGAKGDIRLAREGDTLQLEGTFDGARVTVAARRLEYPLLRSRFRWISDR